MNKRKYIIVIGAASLVLLFGILTALSFRKTEINLNNYLNVTFKGYDGYGQANIKFDKKKLLYELRKNADVPDNIMGDGDIEDIEDVSITECEDFFQSLVSEIEYNVDKSEELKNGDKVKLNIKFDNEIAKDFKINFVAKSQIFTVAGLKETKKVDPFENITVVFTGASPYCEASVEGIPENGILGNEGYIEYDLDCSSGLSIGDTVRVSLEFNRGKDYTLEVLREYEGIELTSMEKEYKVENVAQVITNSRDIPNDLLSNMRRQTEDVIKAYFAERSEYITYSGLKYTGYYFLTSKSHSENQYYYENDYGATNCAYIVYSAQVISRKNEFRTTTVYFPVEYRNLVKNADGTGYVKLDAEEIEGETDLEFYLYDVAGYTNVSYLQNDLVTSRRSEYNVEYIAAQ